VPEERIVVRAAEQAPAPVGELEQREGELVQERLCFAGPVAARKQARGMDDLLGV
jgi:hypothetical protein